MTSSVLLLAVTLAALVAQIYLPGARAPAGSVVRRERMPLLARLRLYAAPAALAIAGATTGWALGWLPPWSPALVPAALLAVLCVPVGYTLTTAGIVRGRTRFRRWTEFGGVARRPGGARLQGVAGARGMSVWLAGSRDADETILLLRQLVRGSYQGRLDEAPVGSPNDASAARTLQPAGASGR